MEQTPDTRNSPADFDPFDRDIQLKRALAVLKRENGELRQLVVRLSETILRSVTAGSNHPSLFSSALATNQTSNRAGEAVVLTR